MATSARFYFKSLLDNYSSLSVTTEHELYPKENVADRDRTTLWKPTSTATQIFTIGLPAADSASCLILVSENAYAKGVRIRLEAADDSGFTTNQVWCIGGATSWVDATADDVPLWYEDFSQPGSVSRQWWRLYIDNLPDTNLLVGCIWPTLELDTARHPGGEWSNTKTDRAKKRVERGHPHRVIWGDPLDIRNLRFLGITKLVRDEIVAGYELVKGANGWPFFYRDEYGTLRMVTFKAPYNENHHRGLTWNMAVRLDEEPD